MVSGEVYEAAMRYAKERSWAVFPLAAGSKKPMLRGGFKIASSDLEQIERWSEQYPDANLGVNCAASGIVPLDVDPKNGGESSLIEVQRRFGELHAPKVFTPSGGCHFYYRQPAAPIKRRHGILPGIDLCGVGGYVVAPPSRIEGTPYAWDFEDAELPTFPADLLEYLHSREVKAKATVTPITEGKILAGSRNSRLLKMAGALRRQGMPPDLVREMLLVANEKMCEQPLPEDEIDRTILRSAANIRPAFNEAQCVLSWLRHLTGNEHKVLTILATWANDEGICSPPRSQICTTAQMAEPNFHATVASLRAKGVLQTKPRGHGLSTIYRLSHSSDCPLAA